MTYETYQFLIGDFSFSKWVKVVAISYEAAKADVEQAYGLPAITWGMLA